MNIYIMEIFLKQMQKNKYHIFNYILNIILEIIVAELYNTFNLLLHYKL